MRGIGPDAPTLCEGWTTRDLADKHAATLRKPYGIGGVALMFSDLGDGTRTGGIDLDTCRDEESGELVRLAIVDGNELGFVAKAQGATRGLRYAPDMGLSVPLSCSAAGHAWLSTMSDEDGPDFGQLVTEGAEAGGDAERRS